MLTFKQFLEDKSIIKEKRKDSEKNIAAAPRIAISKGETGHKLALELLLKIPKDELNLYGVTMTEIPKVGINPSSQYDTPNAIYFYPADYYIEIKNNGKKLDFADDAPYINVIKFEVDPSRILHLSKYTLNDLKSDVVLLRKYYSNVNPAFDDHDWLKEASKRAKVDIPAGLLWYITMKMSKEDPRSNPNPNKWNYILRKVLNYPCVIDDEGEGIIHEMEPTQGLVLDTTKIKLVGRFDYNPKNTSQIKAQRSGKIEEYLGQLYTDIKTKLSPTKEEARKSFIDIVKNYKRQPKESWKFIAAYAFKYAKNIIKKPFKDGESAIATDPNAAYDYALNILKGPWKEAEPAIATDPNAAYDYALNILKGPWKEAEPAIAKDPEKAYQYAFEVLKRPWKEAEPAIAKDHYWAYQYAFKVLKGPFKLGEPAIAKDRDWAYQYALNILKGPFKLGEPAIAKDRRRGYFYASEVLKDKDPWTWAERYNKENK
jgi:hypothetical protein